MSKTRYGSAKDAAKVLGKSTSQLNDIRDANMLVYDPVLRSASRFPDRDELLRIFWEEVGSLREGGRYDVVRAHFLRTRYLICPTLFAYRMPGGSWEYNLTELEAFRRRGPVLSSSVSSNSENAGVIDRRSSWLHISELPKCIPSDLLHDAIALDETSPRPEFSLIRENGDEVADTEGN